MRYIDKNPYLEAEKAVNRRFLKDCYSQDISSPYPSPADADGSFEEFKKREYRFGDNGWQSLLLKEQYGYCCYCMRRLDTKAGYVNIEHVIPRSLHGETGRKELAYYQDHATVLNENVELADVFVSKNFQDVDDIDREDKMPHIISLANLTVACNGKRNSRFSLGCCCNNSRSDMRMMPLILMPEADSTVEYDANGILRFCWNDGTLDTIERELNDTTLQEIRAVWFHLSKIKMSLHTIKESDFAERIKLFKQAYQVENFLDLKDSVKRYAELDFYWDLLIAYDWFFDYYRRSYISQK